MPVQVEPAWMIWRVTRDDVTNPKTNSVERFFQPLVQSNWFIWRKTKYSDWRFDRKTFSTHFRSSVNVFFKFGKKWRNLLSLETNFGPKIVEPLMNVSFVICGRYRLLDYSFGRESVWHITTPTGKNTRLTLHSTVFSIRCWSASDSDGTIF